MKRGEITLAIFADVSKAFDTVDHVKILEKKCKKWVPKTFLTLDHKLRWQSRTGRTDK